MNNDDDFQEISLDTTLDDIEDLPQFLVFPTGSYMMTLVTGMEAKKVGEHNAITMQLTLNEVIELDKKMLDKDEEPPKEGDVANLAFMLDNKFGVGKLKQFIAPIAEHLEVKTIREAVENSSGLQLAVVLTRSFDKEKGRHYQNFSKVAVL